MFLNVQLDPMRKRTTITHEAAVREGETFHSFHMLFARTEAGEVGSLVVAGADAIVRADRRRPADPTERGPDILLDAKDTRNMTKYRTSGSGGKASKRLEAEVDAQSTDSGMES